MNRHAVGLLDRLFLIFGAAEDEIAKPALFARHVESRGKLGQVLQSRRVGCGRVEYRAVVRGRFLGGRARRYPGAKYKDRQVQVLL
jgi:hypothetical protein